MSRGRPKWGSFSFCGSDHPGVARPGNSSMLVEPIALRLDLSPAASRERRRISGRVPVGSVRFSWVMEVDLRMQRASVACARQSGAVLRSVASSGDGVATPAIAPPPPGLSSTSAPGALVTACSRGQAETVRADFRVASNTNEPSSQPMIGKPMAPATTMCSMAWPRFLPSGGSGRPSTPMPCAGG